MGIDLMARWWEAVDVSSVNAERAPPVGVQDRGGVKLSSHRPFPCFAAMPPAHAASMSRTLLNKVPEVTIWFWLIKVLCTTVGETAADFLNADLGFGLTGTSIVTGLLLAIVLALQMRAPGYVPGLYWATVTLVSVFGTLVTDNLTDNLGVPLLASSVVFGIALAVVFVAWYRSEGTLSTHSIVTTRRET